MVAEFHFPSPLVPSREMYFARCCRQLDFDTWIVADVSLENIFPNPAVKCQRRPSGCLIQAFQEGLSMVINENPFQILTGTNKQIFSSN